MSSTVGRGSQFQVFLPVVWAVVDQSDSALELLIGDGKLVLVVDDEANIREVPKATLETYNYKVITARDGIEALAVYAQYKHEISVVVFDMMMPQIDGTNIIRRLKKLTPFVKIIAVSGLIQSQQLDSVGSVKAFLFKPYTIVELLKTIHLVLTVK